MPRDQVSCLLQQMNHFRPQFCSAGRWLVIGVQGRSWLCMQSVQCMPHMLCVPLRCACYGKSPTVPEVPPGLAWPAIGVKREIMCAMQLHSSCLPNTSHCCSTYCAFDVCSICKAPLAFSLVACSNLPDDWVIVVNTTLAAAAAAAAAAMQSRCAR